MPDKQKSIDYKTVAVEYFLVEDTTQEEVCKIFKCSRRSLMRWVKQYTTDGVGRVIERNRTKKSILYIIKDRV